MNPLKEMTKQEIKPEAQSIIPLRKELTSIWRRPLKTPPHTHENFLERYNRCLELCSTLDAGNIPASHYLLIAETCPLKNVEMGCKVTRISFKQGRSHDITTAYIISDLENIGEQIIRDIAGADLIKIPDEYKEFLLSKCGNPLKYPSKYPIDRQYKGVLDWFGIKKTLISLLNNKIRCLEVWENQSREEYINQCNL